MPVDLFSEYYRWTVSTGGTTAPTAGTSETWTVASSTGAPAASTGVSQFRVVDAADTNAPPEIMIVTNVSGTTWTVTRGGEGGAPWAHAAGWTAIPVLTAQSLGTLPSFPLTNTAAAASTIEYRTNVTADTQYRFSIAADGTMNWGSGAAAPVFGITPNAGLNGLILNNFVNDLYDLAFYGSTGAPAAQCGIRYENRSGVGLDSGLADLQFGSYGPGAALRVNRNRVQIQGNYTTIPALTVIQNQASGVGLMVKSLSGQTADLFELQTTVGVVTTIDSTGQNMRLGAVYLYGNGWSSYGGFGLALGWNKSGGQGESVLGFSTSTGTQPRLDIRSYPGSTSGDTTVASWSTAGNLGLINNLSVGALVGSFGSGTGPMLFLGNDTADPSTNPVGGGILYSSAGVLKARTPDGTVTQIAPSTVNQAQTTLNGTTAGTIVWSMPYTGTAYKKFVGYANGFQNGTGNTISFPVAFTQPPDIITDGGMPTMTASASTVTLPNNMLAPATGTIIIEGF